MNPFALTGFGFLLFYFLFGCALLGAYYWWMTRGASAGKHPVRTIANDPYRIAYLRAGAKEAVAVATVSLVDRGLLQFAEKNILQIRDKDALALVQRPIEREILKRYANPKKFDRYLDDKLHAACAEYERDLLKHGLLPDAKERLQRWVLAATGIGCLLATTLIKIHIALSQGRHNLGFLVILTAIFCFFTLKMASKHPSARGAALLADLRVLFARLRSRASSIRAGGEADEAALLAAVFGLQLLPRSSFPFINQQSSTSNGGDGGGSSCGSSCGGGCGGGCGG